MKAISLIQPWASALFLRQPNGNPIKTIETRSWCPPKHTAYPFRVAVHASGTTPGWVREFILSEQESGRIPRTLPYGALIGLVTITGVERTELLVPTISPMEHLYGDFTPGRWGWMLSNPVPLPADDIIPFSGKLGLWDVPENISDRILDMAGNKYLSVYR